MAESAFRGDRLRGIRKVKKLTLQAIAASAGMDLSQVARYEKGLGEPRATNLEALAVAISVTADYLLEPRTAKELPFPQAAIEQSLARFIRTAGIDDLAAAGLRRVAASQPGAPNTVEAWRVLVEMAAVSGLSNVVRRAPAKVGAGATKIRVLQDLRSHRSSGR